MAIPFYEKDPDAVLDYKVDLAALTNGSWGSTDYLQSGETISTATVTATTGLTVDSSAITDTNTSITAWLSGGTLNVTYEVTFHFTTSLNRTDDRTIKIRIIQE